MRALAPLAITALAVAAAYALHEPGTPGPDGSRMVAISAPPGIDEAYVVTPPPDKRVAHLSQR